MNVATRSTQTVSQLRGGVHLLLNGGKLTMESGSIPIQWFFGQEVLAKCPTQVLIVEQKECEYASACFGARYSIKVSDCITFISFDAPGRHRIAMLVCDNSGNPKSYLEQERERRYNQFFSFKHLESAIVSGDFSDFGANVIGATIVEIEVPKELFASVGESKIAKCAHTWTQVWFSKGPRDQCDYRRRLIFAFTLKPFLWLMLESSKIVLKVFATVMYPLLRLILLFFGFRPPSLFEGIGRTWKWQYNPDAAGAFLKYDSYGPIFRVWKRSNDNMRVQYMPITGFEVGMLVVFCWVIKYLISYDIVLLAIAAAGVVVASVGLLLASRAGKFARPKHDLNRDQSYQKWLTETLSLECMPDKIDPNHVPIAFEGRFIQRFLVSYAFLKIKVCKPFAR